MEQEKPEHKQPIVEFKDFTKSYGDKVVHKGVSFSLFEGEVLTLMGSSGSGKSVLLRSLIGLEKPDSGEVLYRGTDVTKLTEQQLVEIRTKIGYVFQYGALFDSFTVKDNLAYPLREHTDLSEKEIHHRVIETLGRFGLEGSEDLMPSDLSGGMQRRVGVARTIILSPEIILYDEPTSGLDPYNTRQILKIVKELQQQGVTSIMVTHDMASVFAVTDRVAYLRNGKITAVGTAEEIMNSSDASLHAFIKGEAP